MQENNIFSLWYYNKTNEEGVVPNLKWIKYSLVISLATLFIFLPAKQAQAASFNSSNLISNTNFIEINAMSTTAIQNFLVAQGSGLKDFSENGRSAARIIYDAAHGYGDASGTWNGIVINTTTGTVNPGVILATLQKEQSLISDPNRCVDDVLRKAMGYACPDSGGCNSAYAGFTKQVENAAWQLRYNYERASGHGFSDYQVGQQMCFSDWNGTHCATLSNRATASLYRYTPHVYNGNYNFWNLFHNTYRFQVPVLAAKYRAQLPWNQAHQVNFAGYPGDRTTMTVAIYNTGNTAWNRSSSNPVLLGVVGDGNGFGLTGSSSFDRNRAGYPTTSTVAPLSRATFNFRVVIPSWAKPGTYTVKLRPVQEGVAWFGPNIYYTVKVLGNNNSTPSAPSTSVNNAGYHSQTPWNSIHQVNVAGAPGYTTTATVTVFNTGNTTWNMGGNNPVLLGVKGDKYGFGLTGRNNGLIGRARAARLPETTIEPGERATFRFRVAIPPWAKPGLYYTHLKLVKEGVEWFGPDIVVSFRVHPS